ncbi:protein PIN-LIKES 7-like [Iris pallida]|uniref:Protein PIN-LIKES 7-like n=1 Tax=Iris pallida TaxID=29817 RepID=A0AAX6GSM6_IRIPA|nr:protein PIN-LIKES 7-like [Iris pallida]KAJ6834886.1 protein PIN-LIKES 7-like [Iris pallida]
MGLLSLLWVAFMPILQFLLVGLLGALLASGRSKILSPDALREINKVVFYVFTPAIIFSNLAENVTFRELVSWWYMPVNIGIIFLIGSILGWVAVKIVKPARHLEKLVIASCSAGNFGNLMLIVIPPVCQENDNPFGETSVCKRHALSYVSLSMALGGLFIWTHTYSLMRQVVASSDEASLTQSRSLAEEAQQQIDVPLLSSGKLSTGKVHIWHKVQETLQELGKELMSPSMIGAILGFVVGIIPWLKSLLIGANAPLRVIQDSIALLGEGMIPCTVLILGGNLTKGLRKSSVKLSTLSSIIIVRYVLLPLVGIAVVKAAGALRLLPQDPLFSYVLLIQFALPPALAIGTMAQLFNVGQEECSVMFLWTYLFAAPALTIWSTIFMYTLS